jgi:hypothetical protein
MRARTLFAAAMVAALVGCAVIDYTPDADRVVYLAAKDSTYCLWRLGGVELDELRGAKPVLEAVYSVLSTGTDEELDGSIEAALFGLIDKCADERDRAVLKELVKAALEDAAVDEDAFASSGRKAARTVVGGIIDGIAAAETAAGEGA